MTIFDWLRKRRSSDPVYTFTIFQSIVAVGLALVIDRYSEQPDSITSTFTALLCVSQTVHAGWDMSLRVLTSAIVGSFWGLLGSVIWLQGIDRTGTNNLSNAENWWLVARIPLAVAFSMYTMGVMNQTDPGSLTSTVFSALYVQLLAQSWTHQPSVLDKYEVLSTAFVRVAALLIGMCSALLVNVVSTTLFNRWIFKNRYESLVESIEEAVDLVDVDPACQAIHSLFDSLASYRDEVEQSLSEFKVVRCFMCCTDTTKRYQELQRDDRRCRANFELLTAQTFISLGDKMPDLTPEERNGLKEIFRASIRRANGKGFADKEALDRMPNEFHLLCRMIKGLIYHVEREEQDCDLSQSQASLTTVTLARETDRLLVNDKS